MPDFPKCLLIVTAEIDPAVESDWNQWYDEIHLPDALACPGVISGRRYCSIGKASVIDHGSKITASTTVYTTIYELTGPEALATREFKAMRGWDRFTDHIKSRTQVFQIH